MFSLLYVLVSEKVKTKCDRRHITSGFISFTPCLLQTYETRLAEILREIDRGKNPLIDFLIKILVQLYVFCCFIRLNSQEYKNSSAGLWNLRQCLPIAKFTL